MTHIGPALLKKLRSELMAEEERLLAEIAFENEQQRANATNASEERYSSPDDTGSELAEHEKILALEGTVEEMLREVRHALHKMDAGTYGSCDSCGNPISVERLEARPQASLCINCRAEHERAHRAAHYALIAGRR